MKACRVCGAESREPVYAAESPGITSLATILAVPTSVYLCASCGHAQSPNLPDVRRFYDTEYQISAASSDHDQLYSVENGRPVYRTDRQAEVVLDLLDLPKGARILDFGAAKAATLRKILSSRPDIEGSVFDVSNSYQAYWRSWLDADRCATHEIPSSWTGRFDAVTAHYVLEHVVAPVEVVKRMRLLLRPGGKLFLSVPDPIANPGDLLVVDHLNHFAPRSLTLVLEEAGCRMEKLERSVLASALVVVATSEKRASLFAVAEDSGEDMAALCETWRRLQHNLKAVARAKSGIPTAIYGAGFYGTWIASVIRTESNLVCFVDQNPHLQNANHLELPVLAPNELPQSVKVVFAGLNPRLSRAILAQSPWTSDRSVEIFHLD